MSLRHFIGLTALIFFLELVWSPLTAWGIFAFPAFAIFYLLKSADRRRDAVRVLLAGLVFDASSGLTFGRYSALLLAVAVSIWLASGWLAIERTSFRSVFFYAQVFLLEFVLLAVWLVGGWGWLYQLPLIIAQSAAVWLILNWFWPKANFHPHTP